MVNANKEVGRNNSKDIKEVRFSAPYKNKDAENKE